MLQAGAQWREGAAFPSTELLLNAASIWKQGGSYTYDSSKDKFVAVGLQSESFSSSIGSAAQGGTGNISSEHHAIEGVRTLPDNLSLDAASTVSIALSMTGSIDALTVEETVPAGWMVTNISNQGNFVANANTIRWFLLSNFESTLTYDIQPVGSIEGTFSGVLAWSVSSTQDSNPIGGEDTTTGEMTPTPTRTPTPEITPTPTFTPTPMIPATPTPQPTEGPSKPQIVIYDNAGDTSGDLTGQTDFDPIDNRNITIHINAPFENATNWHVYVKEGFGGMKFLGTTGSGDDRSLEWNEGAPLLNPIFNSGPDFNSVYSFRMIRIDDQLGPDDFYTMEGTVGFNVEGGNPVPLVQSAKPIVDEGKVYITDDILGLNTLAPVGTEGMDRDPSSWRAIQLAWNFGVDPNTVNEYHVFVSVDGGPFEFLGQTVSGKINYFWWTSIDKFKTSEAYSNGPQGGHTYQFRIFLLPLIGEQQSMTSGILRYEVDE